MKRIVVLLVCSTILAAPATKPTSKPAKATLKELHVKRRELQARIAKLNAELADVNSQIGKTIAQKIRDEKILIARLPRQEFGIHASHNEGRACPTGIKLKKGQRFIVYPNRDDRWCGGGSKRGIFCDYRGYPRRMWMKMHWKVGPAKAPVSPSEQVTAAAEAELKFFSVDHDVTGNYGTIRVRVVVIPAGWPVVPK